MEDQKDWWKSKTILLALIQLGGGVLTAYLSHNPTWAYGAGAKSILDIALRYTTSTEIK